MGAPRTHMGQKKLEEFGAYRKARELFDFAVVDMSPLSKNSLTARLASQQIASADSICANIEEGYGRGTKKEFAQFLVIARGSARETRGRYERFSHWIPADAVALCGEILGILTATIKKLRFT